MSLNNRIFKTQKSFRMKKLFFIAFSLLLVSATVSAQRYAIIDTKYILDKLPEYKDADKKLAATSEQWQKEIDDKQGQLTQMYRNFDAEQYMLSDELKKKREDQLFLRFYQAQNHNHGLLPFSELHYKLYPVLVLQAFVFL